MTNEERLHEMLSNISEQTGLSEMQAAQVLAESLRAQGYQVRVYFQTAEEAQVWMSFQACMNAQVVMSRVRPDLFHEWAAWKNLESSP